jgi:hypothetical protein
MRKRFNRVEEEDVTSQGGWLFADSFLALMIIFLATISFVPDLSTGGVPVNNTNIGNIAGNNYVQGLNLAYTEFKAEQITTDIESYLKKENFPATTTVIYAKVVGGYAEGSEASDVGMSRALAFSIRMKNAGVTYLNGANIDLGSSKLLKANEVVLRLTLSK